MSNYDERMDARSDRHNQVMSERRYRQIDQQIEAEMTRSEYSAMNQLADSKEQAKRDVLRDKNHKMINDEQLRKQRVNTARFYKFTQLLSIIIILAVIIRLSEII